jgi:hypothetical protein
MTRAKLSTVGVEGTAGTGASSSNTTTTAAAVTTDPKISTLLDAIAKLQAQLAAMKASGGTY